MNLLSASIIGIAMSILTAGAPALAAEPSLGQQEYETHCVMCHGLSGSGDGWLAGHLMQRGEIDFSIVKRGDQGYPNTCKACHSKTS